MKNPREIETLLEFYAANGVDCALDEHPHDRFNETAAIGATAIALPIASEPEYTSALPALAEKIHSFQAPAAPRTNFAPAQRQTVPDADALEDARAAAGRASSLDELREVLAAFEGCNLKRTAKNLVFGDGNPNARVMFVGEAPGRDEDISGIPFVGRSGELLNKMLAAISLNREEDVYIANIVPWRPPGNRTPTAQESELCRPFIERQIELVNPDILVPLGAPAARQLLDTPDGIMKLRGKIRPYALKAREIEAIATLHPAYLLRQPGQKRLAWQDLLKIKKRLQDKPLAHQTAPV